MSLVILPISIVNVSICVNQSSFPIGLVSLPVSLVDTAIAPNLVARSISLVLVVPLALINLAVWQDNLLSKVDDVLVRIFQLGFVEIEWFHVGPDELYSLSLHLELFEVDLLIVHLLASPKSSF
jgi:hypothetical protein